MKWNELSFLDVMILPMGAFYNDVGSRGEIWKYRIIWQKNSLPVDKKTYRILEYDHPGLKAKMKPSTFRTGPSEDFRSRIGHRFIVNDVDGTMIQSRTEYSKGARSTIRFLSFNSVAFLPS